MSKMSKFRLLPSSGMSCLALVAMVSAAAAPAQVIEIGDDGTVRTFNAPTRFVGAEAQAFAKPSKAKPAVSADAFERAAKAEGVDVQLLRAVAWRESRWRMDAVSPKGALGIMQLMPGTAAELGVNPFDRDANVHGGARYLARQMSRFGSVPLALAAYNAGPGAVMRWGGIPPYAETQAYVASIMAHIGKPMVPVLQRPVAKAAPRRPDIMLLEVP